MSATTYNDYVASTKLTFVPSFYFITSKSKSTIEERISIIMSSVGVNIFGYKKNEDEYWGKITKSNYNKTITITLYLFKITEKETRCIISIFNTDLSESKKISFDIFKKIKNLETSKLIYRN